MEGVEGVLVDETSQMSVDMERGSDLDSVAPADDLPRTLQGSRGEKALIQRGDRTFMLVKTALESGIWDQVLPRYEKQVLLAATSTERAWRHFLDSSVIPSASALASSPLSGAHAPSSSSASRKSATGSTSKPQKTSTRSKRGTSTPRRRGSEPDPAEPSTADSNTDSTSPSREHIETLHTRLRTLIFDTLIDEVLFPHDSHLELIPVHDSIKQEFGLPLEQLERSDLEPYFTYDDLKEVKDSMNDASENAMIEYSIPPITDMLAGLEAPSLGPSTPVTPSGVSDQPMKGKAKRKIPGNKSREARALFTDSKSTRKWERLELIGASQEYRDFVNEMDSVLTVLKDSKPHVTPFLKPLKESEAPDYKEFVETPMDLTTLGRNLENMLYWNKSKFERDLNLIFNNARAYYTTPDSTTTLHHAIELETLAKPLLSKLSDLDFTQEKDSLRDNLAQVLPEIHGVAAEIASVMQTDDTPFDPQADAIKRTNFFKENPAFTNWRTTVKQRLESPSDSSSDTSELFVPSGTSPVTPDPLFELPKMELLPSHWRVASTPAFSSLDPQLPLIRAPLVHALSNPSVVLPNCAAQRLVQQLSHRNTVLLQRIKDYTSAKGLAPLDPAVERPIPPPESSGAPGSSSNSDELRVNLIEPSIKLVMRTPPPGQAPSSGSNTPAPGAQAPGSTPPTTNQTAPANGDAPQTQTPAPTTPGGTTVILAPEPKAAGKAPAKMNTLSMSASKIDPDDEMEAEEPVPIRIPFFSEENYIQEDPLLDELPFDASSLTNSRLNEETVSDLLKQTVGVELALHGYQGSHDIALNVLSEVVAAFVSRIGFVATTHLSAPGSLLPLPKIMDRTLSEVFPRGISSLKSFVASETIKSDNCLKLLDPSTFMGWVEASPTLNPCLTANESKAIKAGLNPQKAAADAVLTQLIREDKLDEKSMALGETREFYLQQAPFAKRTSSHYSYKPLAYFGSTSAIAVGTPSGLHHVVPTSHPSEQAKAAMAAQQAAAAAAAAHHHHQQQQQANALPPPHMQGAPSPHHMGPGGMQSPGPLPMQGMPQAPPGSQGHPSNGPGMIRNYPPNMTGSPHPVHAPNRLPPGQLPPGASPSAAGAKKGQVPGTMGYPTGPHVQHMQPGYPGASPSPRGPYGQPMHAPGQPAPNYSSHPGLPAAPMNVVASAKKSASPIPAKVTAGARPRPTGTPIDDPSRIPDDPSPRGTSAKRKRPQSFSGAPEDDDPNAEGNEGRRTRSRRGNATAYGDEYMYEEEFDDTDDGEPKRKKRKTPAKSAKRS